jgi:hypothetical protein
MVDLAAMEAFFDRKMPVIWNMGIIVAISGSNAIVKPLGSTNTMTCPVSPNMVASAGDRCLMAHHKQESNWIVVSTFSNNRAGNPGGSPNTPAHARGALHSRTVHYFTGTYSTATINSTSYAKAYSFQVRTRSETLLVGFMGTARLTNTSAVESALYGTIYWNGTDMTPSGATAILVARGRTTLTDRSASFIFPVKGVKPGIHTFDLYFRCSVTTNTTQYVVTPAAYWIMEM